MWAQLDADVNYFNETDENADEGTKTIDLSTWNYFKSGFNSLEVGDQSMVDVYAAHEQETLKKGLVKYTGIFYNIGMLLIVFAVLIAFLSKPLNKLMHGVK